MSKKEHLKALAAELHAEKMLSDVYYIFSKANDRIKRDMLTSGLIDPKIIIKSIPSTHKINSTKFKI